MKAILLATGHPVDSILGETQPPPLLPLFDRPFVQHVVEHLVHAGVQEIHAVLCMAPERFEALLEEGHRWGVRIVVHLVRDPAQPYGHLRAIDLGAADDLVLLASGDRLPRLTDFLALAPSGKHAQCVVGPDGTWTGWAWLTAGLAATFASDDREDQAEARLRASAGASVLDVPLVLSSRTVTDLMQAHEAIFAGRFPDLLLTGREVEPGIWLSRNVVLHPAATLEPPVYVNADCRIAERVHLGPHAVVGARCVVDAGARVHDALVLPGSYLGAGVDVSRALVDRNLLVSERLGAGVRMADAFILGSMQICPRWPRRLLNAAAALVLVLALFPVVVLSLLAEGKAAPRVRRCVRLPADPDANSWTLLPCRRLPLAPCGGGRPDRWRHLLQVFLPGLLQVMLGRMALVGLDPKTPDELLAMPGHRRELFLRGENGLVSECYLLHGSAANPDQAYTAEAYFLAATSWRHNLGLLVRYAISLVVEPLGATAISDDSAG